MLRINGQCTNKAESGERSRNPIDEAAKPKLTGGVPDRYANVTRKHRHANTLGGRARQCQVYSRKFCQAVCEGIAAQKRLGNLGLRSERLMSIEEMEATVAMASEAGASAAVTLLAHSPRGGELVNRSSEEVGF